LTSTASKSGKPVDPVDEGLDERNERNDILRDGAGNGASIKVWMSLDL
jgi:hypothetical protein